MIIRRLTDAIAARNRFRVVLGVLIALVILIAYFGTDLTSGWDNSSSPVISSDAEPLVNPGAEEIEVIAPGDARIDGRLLRPFFARYLQIGPDREPETFTRELRQTQVQDGKPGWSLLTIVEKPDRTIVDWIGLEMSTMAFRYRVFPNASSGNFFVSQVGGSSFSKATIPFDMTPAQQDTQKMPSGVFEASQFDLTLAAMETLDFGSATFAVTWANSGFSTMHVTPLGVEIVELPSGQEVTARKVRLRPGAFEKIVRDYWISGSSPYVVKIETSFASGSSVWILEEWPEASN